MAGYVVRVELDIFSGRPNPTWFLSAQETRELVTRLRKLPSGSRKETGNLGYRGFLIHKVDSRGISYCWLHIAHGAVSVSEGQTYADTEGIEALLRTQAEREGFGTLLEDVPSQ